MKVEETLNRLLSPIWRRLRLIVSRGVVSRSDDTTKMQTVQADLLAGETALMERFQNYGFTSRPLDGAEAIAVAVGGARGHLVAIALDDRRYRMTSLKNGEVALYTDEGDYIHFKRGRIVEVSVGADLKVTAGTSIDASAPQVTAECDTAVVMATTSATFDTPQVTCTGQLLVKGAIVGQGGLAVTGGSGATVEGDMNITNGDVKADTVSLKTLRVTGVQSGTSTSGVPVQ